MNFSDADLYAFKFRFQENKNNLSSTSKKMISTLFDFIRMKPKNKKTRIKKTEIKQELERLNNEITALEDDKVSELLINKYSDLENMIINNEPYFDLLIKLECAVGIYPDEIFLNKARQIFCDEIYVPIITGTYVDEYKVKSKMPVKTRK